MKKKTVSEFQISQIVTGLLSKDSNKRRRFWSH